MSELASKYDPTQVEESLYKNWKDSGCFVPSKKAGAKPYTIVIPPPNVTGILHMGHALNNTIQDILIRWKRMQGQDVLWVPGTDHAGIATQNVVEKSIAKEGKKRQDLGREAFLEKVWEWKEQYGGRILYQLERLGSSCDWNHTRFTMDEGLSDAVKEVFVRLYEEGLIYRGSYIINWCPRCQTALADEEAPREEAQGKLYHIKYPIYENSRFEGQSYEPESPSLNLQDGDAFIEVATTRPETLLGDTAIAVHPEDERLAQYIGKHALLPLVGRKIPIIADTMVDLEFGTGAVKITPAHDPADFQTGKRHDLAFINVMTDDARMQGVSPAYEGLDRFECRSKIIIDLEMQHFLGPVDEHAHNVGHCYRCHTVVEPRMSPQWFVSMQKLAEPAIKAVKDGDLRFSPNRWSKVYLNWMENIQDWCISRQIWWGHRLPVWYCDPCAGKGGDTAGVVVSKQTPDGCPKCGNEKLRQDPDVLDTWFSSWLWPFSTLGWPEKTEDLERFYPTNTLVTAPDIIFFWVARMVMAGFYCMGKQPFSDVYIHGVVRDITGRKMSKSLGNSIDPLEVVDQYGTDALRYTLITSTAIGQDIFLAEERFLVGRNFANKLWNATRFVLSKTDGAIDCSLPEKASLTLADKWIVSRLQHTIKQVTRSLEQFMLNEAATTLYDFIWKDFCDWYIEIAKVQSREGDEAQTQRVLFFVLENIYRLLHPFMPFVTEVLWQQVQGQDAETAFSSTNPSIMTAEWPKAHSAWMDEVAEAQLESFKKVIVSIRNTKAELNVGRDKKPSILLRTENEDMASFLTQQIPLLQSLAQVGEVTVDAKADRPEASAASVVDGIEVFVLLAGLIDVSAERERIHGRVVELTQVLQGMEKRLNNKQFVDKAPDEVVAEARSKKAQVQETLQKFEAHLKVLETLV